MSRRTTRASSCRCSPPAGPSEPTWISGNGEASAISPRPPGSGWASPLRADKASSRNCFDDENSKPEIRNPKQIRMTEIQVFRTGLARQPDCFEHLDFEFVSDLVLRISDSVHS